MNKVEIKIKREPRRTFLKALFAKARELGIDPDQLRDEIAPEIIKKRLSAATAPEIGKVIDHITKSVASPRGNDFKYPSTKDGLIEELRDVAFARWGADYERSLNAFINANRKVKTHYAFVDVSTLKAVKNRIKALNSEEGIGQADG